MRLNFWVYWGEKNKTNPDTFYWWVSVTLSTCFMCLDTCWSQDLCPILYNTCHSFKPGFDRCDKLEHICLFFHSITEIEAAREAAETFTCSLSTHTWGNISVSPCYYRLLQSFHLRINISLSLEPPALFLRRWSQWSAFGKYHYLNYYLCQAHC